MPTLHELIESLPAADEEIQRTAIADFPDNLSMRPVPIGRLRRLSLLGTLQAKIAAAYLFYWLRGWFTTAPECERSLADMHWRTAIRLLDSMSYMRGAAMKIGQTLANFPDIAPQAFVDTLDKLHFNAPPMHWSLLQEMVHSELDGDPKSLFASFEERAFAAASLGQVHGARLKSGDEVVLKVQYPGVARTIGEDMRNLLLFLLPSRLSKDWDSMKDQFDDLCVRLERECDYEVEAATQEKVRGLFRDSDGIVVPRVFAEFSTKRVLTMERIRAVHLDEFMARCPSQAERNAVAERMVRAWYRMMYAGRLLYIDFHPGNLLVLEDGRVGMIDFGMMVPLNDDLWRRMQIIDKALTTGQRADRIAANQNWCELGDDECHGERMQLIDDWADWCWRSRYCGGEFDFGDETDFRQGVELFGQMVKRRYSRGQPCTPLMARSQFGWRSILYRLKARLDIRSLAEQEVKATGWDRSDYA